MNHHRRINEAFIPGGGGGGGKGGGGGVEAPDSLRSRQMAKIVDLLGEGPNVGIVGWTKGIFYDGVPLQNQNGTFNFSNAIVQEVVGDPDQPVLSGFEGAEDPKSVGIEVRHATPIEQFLDNQNADRVRIIMSVPSLQRIDDEGNISGTSVSFKIEIDNNGGGFENRGTFNITGKTSSAYQRQIVLSLPAPGPWTIRVTRITADSTSTKLMNQLFWDFMVSVIDVKVNYTNSHCVGTIIDAEQFGSIPARTYLVDGRLLAIPSNYDPILRTYTGVWDGTFITGWTNNPAWVLWDMITHRRYGLGQFIAADELDKWAFYEIAKWCDEAVPNGKGGTEPRFVCNRVVAEQMDAFDVLTALASIFRGFVYWDGSHIVPVADQPRTTTGIYSPANVIDGVFNYSGADLRARHNMVTARWLDGDHLGQERYSIAEDRPSISKYGIMDINIEALGATTEGQAQRAAKWMIYTENYETEVVQFKVGLDGAWTKPGDIITIADPVIGGERRGGRVVAATQNSVTLDSTVAIAPTSNPLLSCIIGEGKVERMRVTSITDADGLSTLQLFNAFTAAPAPGTPWLLTTDDLQPTLWRTVAMTDNGEDGSYTINAQAFNPGKWDYIEENAVLTIPDTSNINVVPEAVTGLRVEESLIQLNVNSIGVLALISFTSPGVPYWDIDVRPDDGNWQRSRSLTTGFELQVTEGWWTFNVTPVSLLGVRGPTTSLRREILGRYLPPLKVENFRVVVQSGMALFRWTPSPEIDVQVGGHFELRFSPRADGSARWDNATTIVDSVAGSASSTEAFYQAGTWFLKTFDIVGMKSLDEAIVLTTIVDQSYQAWVRICEQETDPPWAGAKSGTVAEDHEGESWLVLEADTATGTYTFFNNIDMGGIFTARLALDMLSAPYLPGDPFMDERTGTVDSWANWDNLTSDLDGLVLVEMRQTNVDPDTAIEADWSAWEPFTPGDHTGWGFQFRAKLSATPPQNVAVQELCILADVSNKIDQNKGPESTGVVYTGAKMPVGYSIDFQSVPAITVTMQGANVGDYILLTNKTRYGFDIELKNGSAQLPAGRKFDWHAMGY